MIFTNRGTGLVRYETSTGEVSISISFSKDRREEAYEAIRAYFNNGEGEKIVQTLKRVFGEQATALGA